VLGQEKIKLENVYSKIARRRNGIRDPIGEYELFL